jgi:murein DD-endopeptidase MepM/ murein hydrolase activator NlpD
MEDTYQKIFLFFDEVGLFVKELISYIIKNLHLSFLRFEEGKGIFVTALYKQRGKQARRLMHSGMAGLAAVGMMIAPMIAQEFPGRSIDPWEIPVASSVLSATTEDPSTNTLVSEKVRDKIIEYTVQEGDTVSSVAEKFGVSEETVLWQNDLSSKDSIKVGQTLEILPVTGISHRVQKGDTVYSIAKKYDTSAQGVVDFPYNTFVNDETFELAVGQTIIVPEGVAPSAKGTTPRIRRTVPDAGTVVASGSFVWPAGGQITQNFVWYHKGIDIANRAAPNVVAADSGTVVYSGCLNWGYGCHVIIDHGNGYRTLYGHLSSIYVNVGQGINRGVALGRMGSTGRSTGIHLHFEVIRNGVHISPFSVLQ